MKIIGTEGLDAHTIRNQVDHGARFVIYQYCFSIIVMTFKRPSSVHYIKPGHSRLARGAPFSAISLLFGWWGIPWGPIYTMQALTNNFSGGIDVTNEVLASFGPVHDTSTGAPLPPPMPVPVRHPGTGKKVAIGGAILAALIIGVIGAICLIKRSTQPVVLISGAPTPYTIQLNGVTYTLAPNQATVLHLSEGDYTLQGGPAGSSTVPQTLHLSIPFFDNLSQSRVAVINPDRAAIFYYETTAYYPTGTTAPANEALDFNLYADEVSYYLPAPDYVFAAFPQEISMGEGSARETRSRFELLRTGTPAARAKLLLDKRGYAVMEKYLENAVPLHPDDEAWLAAAATYLKPEDGRALFTRGLAVRPIHVEWHRYYQEFMQRNFPDFDLVKQYREFSAADPQSGALLYLYARLIDDPAENKRLSEAALAAKQPSPYAALALGYDYLVTGDYPMAMKYFQQAAQGGLHTSSLDINVRYARLGLHDYAGLLADAAVVSKQQPNNLDAVGEEIALSLLAGHSRAEAEQLAATFLSSLSHLKQISPQDRADAQSYLTATIDYGAGDVAAYAAENAKVKTPDSQFVAALCTGSAAQAATLLKSLPAEQVSSVAWLECYIVAKLKGDDATAETAFANSLDALVRDSSSLKPLVATLRSGAAPSAEMLAGLQIMPPQKSLLVAALALRFPPNRAELGKLAAAYNIDPSFPHHLIALVSAGN
ncbi:MAG TPA: hypothetical protein VHC95_08215 [Opitutales bacterium]|nr:hypothetical protein [Opitutales bacterium]